MPVTNFAATLSSHAEWQKDITLRADQVLTPDSWESGPNRVSSVERFWVPFPSFIVQATDSSSKDLLATCSVMYHALMTQPLPDNPLDVDPDAG